MKIRNTVHLGPMIKSLISGFLFTITINAAEPPAPANHQVETVPTKMATSSATFPTTVTIPLSSSNNVVEVIGNSNIVVNGNIIASTDNKARTSCASMPQAVQRNVHNSQRVYMVPASTIQVIRPEPVIIVSPYVTTFWSPSPMMNRYGYNHNSGYVYEYPANNFGYNYYGY